MQGENFCPEHKNLTEDIKEIKVAAKEILHTLRGYNGNLGMVTELTMTRTKVEEHLENHKDNKTKLLFPLAVGFVILALSNLILWAAK